MPSHAERAPMIDVQRQSAAVSAVPLLGMVMDTIPDAMVVLNDCRQIVYANRAFMRLVEPERCERFVGQRTGEAVGCVCSDKHQDGCGASAHCAGCGVVVAALNSLAGIPDTQETIIHVKRGTTLDIQVWSTPFDHEGQRYLLFCLVDRLGPQRRRVMERLFFHDLLARQGLEGMVDILAEREPQASRAEGFARTVFTLSTGVLDEIEAQRELAAAEAGSLTLSTEQIQSREFLDELARAFREHRAGRERNVVVHEESANLVFHCDRGVFRRTLGHLLKNALQASLPGETVTLRCAPHETHITFEVHNTAFIPRSRQEQIFQRIESEKGLSRLGTYSARLMVEKILGGRIEFTTHRRKGTVFLVHLPRTR